MGHDAPGGAAAGNKVSITARCNHDLVMFGLGGLMDAAKLVQQIGCITDNGVVGMVDGWGGGVYGCHNISTTKAKA